MRPSLIPGLVAAAERNARRGLSDVALFEVGQIFLGPGENDQRIAAAAVRRGRAKADAEGRNWSGGGLVDVFDAKRDAMTLLSALGVNAERGPGRPRRPVVPASGPLGDAPVRAEDRRRLVRTIAPERVRGARRRRADRRLRDHARRHSGAEGEADQDQAEARPLGLHARRAGPRLRRRRDGRRRRHRQGGGERRALARRQGRRVRRLSRRRRCRRARSRSPSM